MYNPITKNRSFLIAYFMFWMLVAVLQAMLIHWTQEVPWLPAIVEGVVYAIMFGGAGLSIWFVVRFTGLEVKNLWNALINHVAAASLIIFVWLVISYSLSALLLGESMDIREASMTDLGWRIALGFIYYVLVALNYYLLIFYQNFQEKQFAELEMRSLLKESELSMLKAQLNPHFIFNSLNSISALTLTRPEDAHEMIVKLSTFLRHTIGQSETELVTIQKEIETISLYLAIERSRFGDKLSVQINGMDGLSDKLKLPNLILQPLIENAIKYGVYESTVESKIDINVAAQEEYLVVEIINSCEERPTGKKGKGIGLKNVQGRLQYIYDRSDLLTTEKSNDTYKAILRIPQEANEQ